MCSYRSQSWYSKTENGQPSPMSSQLSGLRGSQNCFHLVLLIPCIIMIIISMIISYSYNCNRWMAIMELCGNMFLVACDVLFLLCFPKFPIFTLFISCTIAICTMQCVGDYVWCQNLNWTYEGLTSYIYHISNLCFTV